MFKIVYVYFYEIETTFEFEHKLKETVPSLKLYIIINKYMYMLIIFILQSYSQTLVIFYDCAPLEQNFVEFSVSI